MQPNCTERPLLLIFVGIVQLYNYLSTCCTLQTLVSNQMGKLQLQVQIFWSHIVADHTHDVIEWKLDFQNLQNVSIHGCHVLLARATQQI